MSIQITLLTTKDIPHAIRTIQSAFVDDPFNFFIYDQSKLSLARNAASLGIRLRWGITNGHVLVAHTPGRRCAGIAMWVPPKPLKEKRTWWECGQAWWLWIQQFKMNLWHGRGGLRVDRYWLWKKRQAEMQKEVWTDEKGYWFLNILAVHPDSQGKGIGGALVRHISQMADGNELSCYLESSKFAPNVAIYERLGYRLVKEMTLDDHGDKCSLYSMIRDPSIDTNPERSVTEQVAAGLASECGQNRGLRAVK